MVKSKKKKPLLVIEINSEETLEFCHDEVVALAAKMAKAPPAQKGTDGCDNLPPRPQPPNSAG